MSAPTALRMQCVRHFARAIAHLEQFCPDASERRYERRLVQRACLLRREFMAMAQPQAANQQAASKAH